MWNQIARTRRRHIKARQASHKSARALGHWRGGASELLEARMLLAGDLVSHWIADDLNSEVNDGEAITSWVDSIGGVSATASGTPLLNKGALSGRSLVSLDASDGADFLRVLGRDSTISNANDFSVAVAFVTSSDALMGGTGPWYENTGLVDSNLLNLGPGWGLSINQAGQISTGLGGGFFEPVTNVYSSASGLNDGSLHLATVSRSGSTLSLYIDGGTAATVTNANASPRDQVDLMIGALQQKTNPFTGGIAEVRIYNGALTASEVSGLYQEVDSTYNNVAPTATADTYNFNEDPPFGFINVIRENGVLANDSDSEGECAASYFGHTANID